MNCSDIPAAAFVMLVIAIAVGFVCGWVVHRVLGKPREVVIPSPRGAKGRFVRQAAKFDEPRFP